MWTSAKVAGGGVDDLRMDMAGRHPPLSKLSVRQWRMVSVPSQTITSFSSKKSARFALDAHLGARAAEDVDRKTKIGHDRLVEEAVEGSSGGANGTLRARSRRRCLRHSTWARWRVQPQCTHRGFATGPWPPALNLSALKPPNKTSPPAPTPAEGSRNDLPGYPSTDHCEGFELLSFLPHSMPPSL